MISETGHNLSILIVTEPEKDWETFGTWYSIYKNLPDAQIVLACQRNNKTPFVLFQWTKKLRIPIVHHNKLTKDDTIANTLDSARKLRKSIKNKDLMIVFPLTMVLDTPDLEVFSKSWINQHAWFLQDNDIDILLDQHFLIGDQWEYDEQICPQAKESEDLSWLINYSKGCGRWIHTLRGCPFSNALGLVNAPMTVNETRVFEMWQKLCPLYNALT
jgi:hypothetical protein